MSQPQPNGRIRDRTARLQAFGVLALICGAGACALGLAHVLLPRLLATDVGAPTASLWISAITYVAIGTTLIWCGIGSLLRRRWVRSVMLVLGGTWLLAGVLGTLLMLAMLDDVIALATLEVETPPAYLSAFVRGVVVSVSVLVGIVVPAAFLLAYRDPAVFETCAAADPRPAWTERCPLAVLTVSLGLGAAAVLAVPLSIRPVFPLFGRLVTGPPGALLTLAGGVACAWLARASFRMTAVGWWGTSALLVGVAVSVVATFLRVEPVDYLRELGYPDAQLAVLRDSPVAGRGITVGATVALTLASLAYMVSIRRYYSGATRRTA